jgi:hypothetical protein
MWLRRVFGAFLVAEGLLSMAFSEDRRALSHIGRGMRAVGGAALLIGG